MQAQRGAPVLLMHQEFLNGDSWFKPVGSQNQSRLLPLMLFDEGFDVWIGHQRATYWGHDHAQLGHTETVLLLTKYILQMFKGQRASKLKRISFDERE